MINFMQGPGITSSSLPETKAVLAPELLTKDGKELLYLFEHDYC